jgi:carbonic anhydrase
MERLIEGVHRFQNDQFGNYRSLFRKLSQEGQNPHTLFITCSDSRVLAELITQSKPGDLFVVKNVGNIIPPSTVTGSTNSTAAAIEFAVETLRVSDIVVCGHSQCGAMTALMGGLPDGSSMPHLREWLKLAAPVREIMKSQYFQIREENIRVDTAAEENVLFGLENLHSYHCVQERLMDGSLRLHGWFFKIATAELFAYDPETNQFLPLAEKAE